MKLSTLKKAIISKSPLVAATITISTGLHAETQPLHFEVYSAPESSFSVNSTLIYGEKEAIIIDAGFSNADALRIAANVYDSGKKLTTIFISQSDPDYYFGTSELAKLFPDANIITTPAVREMIQAKMAKKVAFWGPQMGTNAPEFPILPEAYTQSSFSIEGHKVEIKGTQGVLANRPYLWIPSEKAILGNIGVFGDLHVWTADTQTQARLDAWSAQLSEMLALKPTLVIPGHMKVGTALDATNIQYTKTYLADFEKQKTQSQNSQQLIDSMMASYPAEQVPLSLTIGAKVHMGEMKW